jgi:hypothetical protein
MPWHTDRPGRNENAPTASVDRPSSWLTGEPRFGFAVRQAADAGAQARTMQDTPFVLCDWDVDGSSRHWPTRRQLGRTGGAGGLKPDVALTSPSSAGAPGSVAKPASGATTPARGTGPCRSGSAPGAGEALPRSPRRVRSATAYRATRGLLETACAAWRRCRERCFEPAIGLRSLARFCHFGPRCGGLRAERRRYELDRQALL